MGNPNCRWHHGQCAGCYCDDDPDRCPFCHRSWPRILRDAAEGGQHSCERSTLWSDDERWRVGAARVMRQEAMTRWRERRTASVSSETLAWVSSLPLYSLKRHSLRAVETVPVTAAMTASGSGSRSRRRPKFGKG